MTVVVVDGFVEAEYGPIADVFARLSASHPQSGGALCVYQHGREVVRLGVGGMSTATRLVVFSVSKLILSLAVHRAVSRGDLDLNEDVGSIWRSFADAGGRGIRISDVLAHRTSLAALDVDMALTEILDGGDRAAVLAAAPFARATRDHGYHAVTFGTLMGAVLEARYGLEVGEWLARELGPVGEGIQLGAGPEGVEPIRFAQPVETIAQFRGIGLRDGLLEALTSDPQTFNSAGFLAAGLPSMGVVTSADALARLMASTMGEVDGFRLLDDRALADMTAPQSWGTDRVLGVDTAFGLGPQLPFARLPMTGPSSFGHEGAGGCVAFADPRTGLAVAFTTNVFPAAPGASPVLLALLPTLALLADAGAG
ncbi:serine hydrolase domain-containing protein [Microbacterium sp. SSM24]|uniref:serine hydrolase domain-containing protein n=1 Tax=Microbacterium sp. SSM24 TaxID=2991714 RepID=UPI00222691C4|nr:serine hydrolase domain-containing protein [Microbacterium sp. SSM24]MCW3492633.1 beta-lactamase family protein [Microbacterium sp. SSM24]